MTTYPSERFSRLHLPRALTGRDRAGCYLTLTEGGSRREASAADSGIVAELRRRADPRAERAAQLYGLLLERDAEMIAWLQESAANIRLFAQDPARAILAALRGISAEMLDLSKPGGP